MYGATDTPLTKTNIRAIGSANSNFFKALSAAAKEIAKVESKKMADSMQYILYHRQEFKGPAKGHYPRHEPKSKGSYAHWHVVPYGENFYGLQNVFQNEGFNYVDLLMKGVSPIDGPRGWAQAAAKGVTASGSKSKVVMTNGKLFSSQMPQGMDPWIKIKREEFKINVKKAIGDIT